MKWPKNQMRNNCIRPTNDIAHASTELLETEMQNRYFSKYLKSPKARAISGCYEPLLPKLI